MRVTNTESNLSDLLAVDLKYMHEALSSDFPALSGKRLLVTGGAGFLGYYLVKSVLSWNEKGNPGAPVELTLLDNFVRGHPDWVNEHTGDPNLILMKHDIREPLPDTFDDYDYIVHAAGIASPTYYRRFPIECIDANINGLRYILDYAVAQKKKGKPVTSLLFFSSSEIYGDPTPDMIPTPEDYRGLVSCTGPRACYDESKRLGETLCVTFFQQEGVPIKIVRPFNNYGPGLKISDRRVIPDFARDVFNGRDIVLLSDGAPRRTFCYAADAIVGYYKALLRGQDGEAYNIGIDSPEVSIAELADKIVAIAREMYQYQGKVVRGESSESDYLVDNPNRRCPIIDKARKHMDYRPSILLDDGLRRTLNWYSHHRDAGDA